MQDIPRIGALAVTGPTSLAVTWHDGSTSPVDLAGWIARGDRHIAPLNDPSVFARAGIGAYGGNVTWDDDEGDLAIDSEHLRMIAEHQAPFGAGDAVAWQAAMGVSNSETADLLGIVPSTWSSYKSGATIPATVARLCRAMQRDRVIVSAHLRPRTSGRPKGDARQRVALKRIDQRGSSKTLVQHPYEVDASTGRSQDR